jgi:hypothetical protein
MLRNFFSWSQRDGGGGGWGDLDLFYCLILSELTGRHHGMSKKLSDITTCELNFLVLDFFLNWYWQIIYETVGEERGRVRAYRVLCCVQAHECALHQGNSQVIWNKTTIMSKNSASGVKEIIYEYIFQFWNLPGIFDFLKGAQAWDIRSLGFSWFLHHKVSTHCYPFSSQLVLNLTLALSWV